MSYRLPALTALRAFEAAARHCSFKRAAEELSVTPTAISHQVRGLEAYLGFPLFRRLTRSLALTPQGSAMLPKLQEGLHCFAAAIEATRPRGESGRLLVASPPAFAARWLIRHLPGFNARHPDIQLFMSASLLTIDAREGRVTGLEGLDVRDDETAVAIRFGHGDYPSCRVDRLFSPGYTPVCSPRLAAGLRPLRSPADLAHHLLLHDDTIPELMDRPTWAEWFRQAKVSGIDSDAGTHFSDPGLVLSAAIDGVGVALASTRLVDGEIAAGRLVAPFDIVLRRPQAYFFVASEAVADRPVVQAFRDWLIGEAAVGQALVGKDRHG